MSDDTPVLRPRPRRPGFDLTPTASTESSQAPTPAEPANPDLLNPRDAGASNASSRNGSVLNLTSSTLYGIYSPTAFEGSRDESSPWGTEAHSPATEDMPTTATEMRADLALERARSRLSHGAFRGVILPQVVRGGLLFAFGVVYGIITVHLHENHWITPVKLEDIHYYESWQYLGFWGLAGVALGNVLPWLDLFVEDSAVFGRSKEVKSPGSGSGDGDGAERTPSWVAVVRSVGAFVGIAFAMRRLPWQSTTQASLTLALANPVLWYLIDRTKTGFCLSTLVGVAGMFVILGLQPELVPSSPDASMGAAAPALNETKGEYILATGITQEGVAVSTWISSVLFCACVCFGNIGRQLAMGAGARRE
ncbi:INSIG domain-containing protein [Aspergillus sp. HF37]|nr:INSIG domain-containing protein [Aspergillus sp. HF37]